MNYKVTPLIISYYVTYTFLTIHILKINYIATTGIDKSIRRSILEWLGICVFLVDFYLEVTSLRR